MRRTRYQKGSLQRRKHGRHWVWVALWWENGSRRYRTLGMCSKMSRSEAMVELNAILQPLNTATKLVEQSDLTLREFTEDVCLSFRRRKWKASTAGTTEQRVRAHLLTEFGGRNLQSFRRDDLQEFLEEKAASGLSFSVVDHLRWDLRAIFRMVVNDGILHRNPAGELFTPRNATRKTGRIMAREEVLKCLAVLDLRERLIAKLAIFAGMRPGEIFGLIWAHVKGDCIEVVQRIYRGELDTPKTVRSIRLAGLSPTLIADLKSWRDLSLNVAPEAWVFPSERGTALSRDNVWRRSFLPRLSTVGLEWANFQVMRRTHVSLSRKFGIDPKVVADQLGHGLGVNLDVYTQSDVLQKVAAVTRLEEAILQ